MEIEILWSYHVKFPCCHLFVFIMLVHIMNCSAPFVIFWYLTTLAFAYSYSSFFHTLGWAPPWFMWAPTVFVVFMCFSSAQFCSMQGIVLLPLLFHGTEIFTCFVATISAFWALCASTLLVYANTCLLVTSFVSLIADSSGIISVILSSSMPFINSYF